MSKLVYRYYADTREIVKSRYWRGLVNLGQTMIAWRGKRPASRQAAFHAARKRVELSFRAGVQHHPI